MKQLSVIVPAYNMEAYLAQCVESLLHASSQEQVEVIVVNDGSRDGTLGIAQHYAEQYPDTVRVIDKPNGNYGSTINAALEIARGEYVKILDADDRFEGELLPEFVATLRRLQGVDMLVTPFVEWNGREEHRIGYNIYSRKIYDYNKAYDADKILGEGAIRYFMMHGVCYRTALLREMHYRQSEGVSYTDQEWVFYPLFNVKSIAFADIPLYRYNTAREGQTMNEEVQMRSLDQLLAVTRAIAQYFATHIDTSHSATRQAFMRGFVADRLKILYRKYLLVMGWKQFEESNFATIDAELSHLAHECSIEELQVPVNNLLKVDLLRHWRRHNSRHNAFVLWLLRRLDTTMVKVHALIFRRG